MTNRVRRPSVLHNLRSQINITPLIDVLLVLIVIFMVITPVTPTGMNTEIPQPALKAEMPAKQPLGQLVLSVDSGGQITLNRKAVKSTAELSAELQDIFKTRADRTIFVHGSRDLEFNDVVRVIDAAIGGGATRIGLLSEARIEYPQ